MSHRILGLALICSIALAGCNDSDDATDDPSSDAIAEDSGEPILLHARIDYVNTASLENISNNKAEFSVEMALPAFRDGKGEKAVYRNDDAASVTVMGSVQASGTAHVVSDDSVLDESFNKSVSWGSPVTPEEGVFAIGLPENSHIGDGLSLNLEVHAPVAGTQSAHISGKDGSMDLEPQFSTPLVCSGQKQYLTQSDQGCGITLRLDATPTTPKDDIGAIMLSQTKQAIAAPNGEWAMALLGGVYGAITQYREDGHFVVDFKRKYALSKDGHEIELDINVMVWSTARTDSWKPAQVTPARTS